MNSQDLHKEISTYTLLHAFPLQCEFCHFLKHRLYSVKIILLCYAFKRCEQCGYVPIERSDYLSPKFLICVADPVLGSWIRCIVHSKSCPTFGQVFGLSQNVKNCPFSSLTEHVLSHYYSHLCFVTWSQPGAFPSHRSSISPTVCLDHWSFSHLLRDTYLALTLIYVPNTRMKAPRW